MRISITLESTKSGGIEHTLTDLPNTSVIDDIL